MVQFTFSCSFAALSLWLHALVAFGRDDPYCLEVGWRMAGDTLSVLEGVRDPRDCQQECETTDGCSFFRWRARRDCVLITRPTGEWRYDIASVSGPKSCFLPASDFPETANAACKVVGMSVSGSEYEKTELATSTECHLRCNADPRCEFWSWEAPFHYSNEEICKLYDSSAAMTGFGESIRSVSGAKKCPSEHPRFPIWKSKLYSDPSRELPWSKEPVNGRRHLPYCLEWNKRVTGTPGGAYRLSDPRDCSAICTTLQGCTNWNWFASSERCEVFREAVDEVSGEEFFPAAVTGPGVCEDPLTDFPEYSQMSCSTFGKQTRGEVLSTLSLGATGVPDDCLIACEETEGCVAYSYNIETAAAGTGGECLLLSSDTGLETQIGAVSGPPRCQDRASHYPVWKAVTRDMSFPSNIQPLPVSPSPSFTPVEEDSPLAMVPETDDLMDAEAEMITTLSAEGESTETDSLEDVQEGDEGKEDSEAAMMSEEEVEEDEATSVEVMVEADVDTKETETETESGSSLSPSPSTEVEPQAAEGVSETVSVGDSPTSEGVEEEDPEETAEKGVKEEDPEEKAEKSVEEEDPEEKAEKGTAEEEMTEEENAEETEGLPEEEEEDKEEEEEEKEAEMPSVDLRGQR